MTLGGTPLQSAFQAAIVVTILWCGIYFTIVGFIAEIFLDLDQLDCISKRYSGLTVDYEKYFKLTVDLF